MISLHVLLFKQIHFFCQCLLSFGQFTTYLLNPNSYLQSLIIYIDSSSSNTIGVCYLLCKLLKTYVFFSLRDIFLLLIAGLIIWSFFFNFLIQSYYCTAVHHFFYTIFFICFSFRINHIYRLFVVELTNIDFFFYSIVIWTLFLPRQIHHD